MFANSRSKPRGPVRKKPVQQRSRDTVQTILSAAARVLEESGQADFNTNRVAERAGVSIGSVYQYFGDKNELLTALGLQNVERTERELLAELSTLRERRASPESYARGLMDVWCRTHQEAHQALIYAVHSELPALRARADLAFERFVSEVAKQLSAAGAERARLRAQVAVLTGAALVHELIITQPSATARRNAQAEATAILAAYFASFFPARARPSKRQRTRR
jgi:AcrR family transcriptional regulator